MDPEAKPHWARPYPVALKNRVVFEGELKRQCNIGAIRRLSPEEIEEKDRVWASSAFGVPKSNETIRVVIDF